MVATLNPVLPAEFGSPEPISPQTALIERLMEEGPIGMTAAAKLCNCRSASTVTRWVWHGFTTPSGVTVKLEAVRMAGTPEATAMPPIPIPLAAPRVADIPRATLLPPGVSRAACVRCGAKLVISATSRAMIRAGQIEPHCHACLPRDRPLLAITTPAQLAELASFERHAAAMAHS